MDAPASIVGHIWLGPLQILDTYLTPLFGFAGGGFGLGDILGGLLGGL